MNIFSILTIVALLLTTNSFFHILPWLFPRIEAIDIIPYQVWGNALVIFYFILPRTSGNDYFTSLSGGGKKKRKR
tara:strand:- start:1899 stop:2123 length:225 start_codon:yes stop_codon:yes gene_type:complete